MSSGESEFGKIRLSDSHALRKGADEVLSVFQIFFDRYGLNSMQNIPT